MAVLFDRKGERLPTQPFRLFREPESDEQFCIFGDPAEGPGHCAAVAVSKRHGDFPFVYNNRTEGAQFGYDLHKMAKYLQRKTDIWPTIAVERNVGAATIFVLQELNYQNLFRMPVFDSATHKETSKIGWLTTKSTRNKMLEDYAMALRQKQAKVYDQESIEQMLAFIYKAGRGQAEAGKDDDLVIAHAGGWQLYLLVPAFADMEGEEVDYEKERQKWRFK